MQEFPVELENSSYLCWPSPQAIWAIWDVNPRCRQERKDLLKIPEAVNAARFYIVKRGDEVRPAGRKSAIFRAIFRESHLRTA